MSSPEAKNNANVRCASEEMGRLVEELEDCRPTKLSQFKTEKETEIAPIKGP